MLYKPLVEFIGTFIFLSVILTQGQAIPIGIALAAVIFFGGAVSGGHFNPAVSFMKLIGGDFGADGAIMFIAYVAAQLLGASAAYGFVNYFPKA
jgi:aquaporin Z